MKCKTFLKFVLFILCFVIVKSIPAQTKTTNGTGIAFINSYYFTDSVKGITKMIKIIKSLETEMKPSVNELERLQTEFKSLEARLTGSGNKDQNLVDKATNLRRDISFKNEDLSARYNKRYTQLMQPLYDQVSSITLDWCKQKGYIALLDISKLTNGTLLWVDEDAVDEATTAFIAYVNSKMQ